jgi:prevent-host-death family protein
MGVQAKSVQTVGARELKTRLGTYLRRVEAGSSLVITERGRPVAELRPLTPGHGDEQAVLQEMIAVGEASRVSTEPLEAIVPLTLRGEPLTRTIQRERDDRY